jgi:polyisoprenoid-binding protein YceI
MKIPAGVVVAMTLASLAGYAQPEHPETVKGESTISYHMSHPLHEFDAVSKEVVYRVDLDTQKQEILSVAAEVDVTTFDSGNSNRDSHAMEAIDAISFPEATFTSGKIVPSGDCLTVSGNLTFHGVTREIEAPVSVRWSDHRIEVRGGFQIRLTEFNIARPSLLMIPVADEVKFTIVAAFKW